MSYNPAAGAIQHSALFSFSHTSGSQSTGALSFTPKVAFYVGNANYGATGGDAACASGFAIGTLTNARASGFDFAEGSGSPQLPGGSAGVDAAAIGGFLRAIQNNAQTSSFDRRLQVTAFSIAGITLTWDIAVNAHSGHLLVLG